MWKLVSSRECSASRPCSGVAAGQGRQGLLCLLAVWNPSPVPAAQLPAELDPLGEGNAGSLSCKL